MLTIMIIFFLLSNKAFFLLELIFLCSRTSNINELISYFSQQIINSFFVPLILGVILILFSKPQTPISNSLSVLLADPQTLSQIPPLLPHVHANSHPSMTYWMVSWLAFLCNSPCPKPHNSPSPAMQAVLKLWTSLHHFAD